MSEIFLQLSRKEQSEILNTVAGRAEFGRSALILEKDIWLCWSLQQLFNMPKKEEYPMVFKGGTSLSKVYQLIQRFSEDIDITIDFKSFTKCDPFAISKTKRDKLTEEIRKSLADYLKNEMLPYFEQVIGEQFKDNIPTIKLHDNETLLIDYPTVLGQKSNYINDSIRLEFGGRNEILPSDARTIECDITNSFEIYPELKNLNFPSAKVNVLSPQRTFWEKMTLIHCECNREEFKKDANRISRHWYDIFQLANNDIGKTAFDNLDLLKDVLKIKETFYYYKWAKYDECNNGNFKLVPNVSYLDLLKEDFKKMLDNGMFYGKQPEFGHVIEQLKILEEKVNKLILSKLPSF